MEYNDAVKIQQEIYNQNDNILLISDTQSENINDFSSMQLIEGKYLTISVNNNIPQAPIRLPPPSRS